MSSHLTVWAPDINSKKKFKCLQREIGKKCELFYKSEVCMFSLKWMWIPKRPVFSLQPWDHTVPHILTGGPSTCNNEVPEINSVKGKAAGNVKGAGNGQPTQGTVVCLLLFSSTLHLEGIQRRWDLWEVTRSSAFIKEIQGSLLAPLAMSTQTS